MGEWHVQMLESEYLTDDYLVAVAIDSVWAVMQVHGPTPLNHYCRLLCKADLASQLLRCMRLMVTVARAGRGNQAMNLAGPGYRPRTDLSMSSSGAQRQDRGGEHADAKRTERAGSHLLSACDLLLVLSHSDSVVKASTGRPENIQARTYLPLSFSARFLVCMVESIFCSWVHTMVTCVAVLLLQQLSATIMNTGRQHRPVCCDTTFQNTRCRFAQNPTYCTLCRPC